MATTAGDQINGALRLLGILAEGETLYRASINSKIPIADIRRINKLKSNSVKPGTKLLLR